MRASPTDPSNPLPLSPLDLQILLVLSQSELYGYAILKALESQSEGVLSPEIGSLYRVLARLMELGWVEETPDPSEADETHRGRPRRYYGVTESGVQVARAEIRRLEQVIRTAEALGPGLAR